MDQRRKILLVDDEEDFCFFAKMFLERTGKYQVRTVHNGSEALRIVPSFIPDLILLDIVMPDMPGDEVAINLMNDPSTRDIPIVFLTALASQRLKDEASPVQNIGGRLFIGKPVSKDQLLKAVDSILN
jgi:CheY-like chemotaxis protein